VHAAAGGQDGACGCSVQHERHCVAEQAHKVGHDGGEVIIPEAFSDDIIGRLRQAELRPYLASNSRLDNNVRVINVVKLWV
jgi:hypothetical protein